MKARSPGGCYQVQFCEGDATIVDLQDRMECGLTFREAKRRALEFYRDKPDLSFEDHAEIRRLKRMRAFDVDVLALKG